MWATDNSAWGCTALKFYPENPVTQARQVYDKWHRAGLTNPPPYSVLLLKWWSGRGSDKASLAYQCGWASFWYRILPPHSLPADQDLSLMHSLSFLQPQQHLQIIFMSMNWTTAAVLWTDRICLPHCPRTSALLILLPVATKMPNDIPAVPADCGHSPCVCTSLIHALY